jgi:hypothetical protein
MFAPSTVLSAIVGIALLAGPAAAIAVPSADDSASQALQERKWRSNIDMQVACNEQYGGNYPAVTVGSGCDDWKCDVDGKKRGLSVDLYCIKRFGSDAYASCSNGVYNWQCHDRT